MSGHTRTTTEHGPDFCAECSEAASSWVPWPCPTYAAAATRAVVAWAKRHHVPLGDVAQLLDVLGLDGLAREDER